MAAWVLAQAPAEAQGRFFGRVSGSLVELYDTNLFAAPTSRQPQSDLVTRFGPAVEAGYRSIPLQWLVRYGFDAERHRTLDELNDVVARQDAAAELAWRRPTFSLTATGSYLETQTPTELNLESLLLVGRSRAERTEMRSEVSYNLTALTSVTAGHQYSKDDLEGGIVSTANESRVGLSRKVDLRHTLRTDYRFRHIGFSDGLGERSHTITGGWVYALTRLVSFEIDAGARTTAGDADPEVAAVLRNRLRRGEVSVAYVKTRDTAIGQPGSIDIQRVSATVLYAPTRIFTLSVTPSRASNEADLWRAVVRALDVEGRLRVNRRWSLVAQGRFGDQDSVFDGRDESIPYRTLSLTSVVTLGSEERDGGDAGTP